VSGRRILVTGVGGFVGPHLVRAIKGRKDVPIGLSNQSVSPSARILLAEEHVLDICDTPRLTETIAAARPDAVIHLAGQSSVGRSFENPAETFGANATGTWTLLEAVRSAAPRARVVCIGSADVYGPQPEGSRVREDAPFHPVSPYGLSKAFADSAAAFYASKFGLDVVRTRSFAHIGPGQSDRFVVPAMARQIAAIEAGQCEPELRVGNLDVTRDLTQVGSVAEAYLGLLDRGRTGSVYNICSGQPVRLSDVAHLLVRRARVPVRVEVDPNLMRPADIPYLVGDPGAIARDVGWRASVDLDLSLDQILDEWRARAA
jgi:GDP-4-dehydro-6-deoxy-D-mannose reductase